MLTEPKSNASEGWTLRQALELSADPQVWDEWVTADAEYKKIRTPIPSSPGSFLTSPDLVAKHRQRAVEAWDAVARSFRELLENGALAATGSRAERSALPTAIHRGGWRTLKFVDFERSIVREVGATKTKIYNVRIFPLVHAPDATDRFRGRSIAAAFLMSVIRDPEVIAASKCRPEPNRHRLVFEQGKYPGLVIQYCWPLELSANELANDFIRTGIFFVDDPIPKPAPEFVHLAAIMVDRWQRLVRRLVDGELVAKGTYALNGELQFIDPFQWARRTLMVDVQNSDLVDSANNQKVVRWSGISLVSPDAVRIVSDVKLNAAASPDSVPTTKGTRRRPISEAVAKALAGRRLAKDPGGRSWKELAGMVAPDMPKYPQTEAAWNALAKAIQRHYASQQGKT